MVLLALRHCAHSPKAEGPGTRLILVHIKEHNWKHMLPLQLYVMVNLPNSPDDQFCFDNKIDQNDHAGVKKCSSILAFHCFI